MLLPVGSAVRTKDFLGQGRRSSRQGLHAQGGSRVKNPMSASPSTNGEPTHQSGKSHTKQSQAGGENNGAMAPSRFNQKISILVFRGYPEDSVDTRIAKLHLAFNENEGRDITFEIQTSAQPVVHELTNQGPPNKRPHFLRKIDVAMVPVSSEVDTTLRDTIRGIPPNPEWDDRNWVDDVLRELQAVWPSQISNSDVTYALNFMVDVLYSGS